MKELVLTKTKFPNIGDGFPLANVGVVNHFIEHRMVGNWSFETLCNLGLRLRKLVLDQVVSIEAFLNYIFRHQSFTPWVHMRHLVIVDFVPDDAPTLQSLNRLLILVACAIYHMPVLDSLYVYLQVGNQWERLQLEIETRYVETASQGDHVSLDVHPRELLTADNIEYWERNIRKARGVPLRVD